MFADLARAVLGGVAAGVLPGYFWSRLLRPAGGWGLAYSAALSMASVPVAALAIARVAGTGVTLWVAIVAAAGVFASGAAAYARWGSAPGSITPLLPWPPVVRDRRMLALIAGAMLIALASTVTGHGPPWLLAIVAAGLLTAGFLAVTRAGPPADSTGSGSAPLSPGSDPLGPGSDPYGPGSDPYYPGAGTATDGPGPAGRYPSTASHGPSYPAPASHTSHRGHSAHGNAFSDAPAAHTARNYGPEGRPDPTQPSGPGAATEPAPWERPTGARASRERAAGLQTAGLRPAGPAPEGTRAAGGRPTGAHAAGSLAAGSLAAWSRAAWSRAAWSRAARARSAGPRVAGSPSAAAATHPQGTSWWQNPAMIRPALAVILMLTAARAYAAPIFRDWPFYRGSDQFSHAVMAEQILAHGSYSTYLVYPPGFSSMTAVICRFSGLTPLELFPVLAPALLILTTLAAYALAARLWGWECGLVAAALSGLVLSGPYTSLVEGRYPDLTAAYFLLVMAVAALITLYASPSLRAAVMVAVITASVVFYHSVGTLYAVLLFAVVAAVGLGYLLLRRRPESWPQARPIAVSLTGALAVMSVLAAVYGWYTYLRASTSGGASSTSAAVSVALGSQPVPGISDLVPALSPPVVWLGLLGVAALAAGLRYLRHPAQVLAALTMLLWCALMYLGSRTAADGFPQRFEHDLGAPLAVVGAFGIVLVLRSLAPLRVPRQAHAVVAATVAGLVLAISGLQTFRAADAASQPATSGLPSPDVAAAGAWLRQHNTGGNIISTPTMNLGISNRAVLAMGGYTGLQSYSPARVLNPRSLPTAGKQPLLDSMSVLLHPRKCAASKILARQDVRYVVLYRFGHDAYLFGFRSDPARYRRVYQNPSVIIYAPVQASLGSCPAPALSSK
ncbi:MAG: hypothetical protein ABJB47_09310 [Actinomycetota bacterium]